MTPTQTYWKGRHVVYRAFDETGRLLYVGRTRNLPLRVSEHRSQSWWWRTLVARVRVEVHPSLEAADAAERIAIQEETPAFNALGVKDWRNNPHWSEADHEMYEAWYLGGISREPLHVQQALVASMFPHRPLRIAA